MKVSVHSGNDFEESMRACLFGRDFVFKDDINPITKTNRFVFKQIYFPLKCFKNDNIDKNNCIT